MTSASRAAKQATAAPRNPKAPLSPRLSPVPNIRSKQGAVDWYWDEMSLRVSYNEVQRKTANGEMPSFRIGGAVHYSSQDLYDYVMRQRRSSVENVGGAA